MCELSMMAQGINWRIAYAGLSLAMVILGFLTWFLLVRVMDRSSGRPGKIRG